MVDPRVNYIPLLFFILCSVSWCMCVLQIVGIYAFNRLRGLTIIEKRYPRLVILEAFVCVLMLAIIYPIFTCLQLDYPKISSTWLRWLFIALSIFTYEIAPIIEICRMWLISYDLQYLHSSKNQQWKTEIDVLYAEKDWYLQNRGKWGNQQYVARFGFLCYIITGTALFTMRLLMGLFDQHISKVVLYCFIFLLFTMHMVLVSMPIYFYVKTPRRLQDQFLFQYEFTWTAIIAMTIAFLYIVGGILQSRDYSTMGWTLNILSQLLQLTPSLLSTLVVPHKVGRMREWIVVKSIEILRMHDIESSDNFRQKWRETLNDEQKCAAFIDWMYREFSGEAILSFLELVQFRKFVKGELEKVPNGMDIVEDPDPYDFVLYDGMPKSTIVYDPSRLDPDQAMTPSAFHESVASVSGELESGTSASKDPLLRCKTIAHLLFRKYIDYHSVHEINISGPLRNKYVDLEQRQYDGLGLEQFATLYEEVISEMMKYQAESYRRFERAYQENVESPRSLME